MNSTQEVRFVQKRFLIRICSTLFQNYLKDAF